MESNAALAEVAGWVKKLAIKKHQAANKGITATYRTKKESNAAAGKQQAQQGHAFISRRIGQSQLRYNKFRSAVDFENFDNFCLPFCRGKIS